MRYVKILTLLVLFTAGLPAQTLTEFPIGAADLIEITVYGVPDFSRELRVSSAGNIRLPFLGEIEVAGMTPPEAEEALADLLNPDYVIDPQVSVVVKEPRSRMFSVLGAVLKPGQYQMLQPITLVTAIAGAGGLDLSRAGDTVTIRRMKVAEASGAMQATRAATVLVDNPENQESASYVFEVDLRKIMQEGDLSRDVPVLPGDVISVPERIKQAFFVIGDVNRPGPFEFPEDQGIKLTRALGMAGGPTKTSKLKNTNLIRQNPDGTVDQMALNLDNVFKGKDPDMELQPNDMIYVPGSVGKNLAWGMLGIVPCTISRVLVPY